MASESVYGRMAAGAAARRVAMWCCLIGLPLAYEASDLLPGAHNLYSGDADYWYSGLYVRLVLSAVGAALVLWALWRSRQQPSSVGWPQRLRTWEWIAGGAVLVGAVALVFYNPGTVSRDVLPVSAWTPVGLRERILFLVLALVEAPAQELVWRGAMINWLRPSIGNGGAALISTASFVFFHPTFSMQWHTLLAVVPVALLYTLLAMWRSDLRWPVLLHFLVSIGQLTVPTAG